MHRSDAELMTAGEVCTRLVHSVQEISEVLSHVVTSDHTCFTSVLAGGGGWQLGDASQGKRTKPVPYKISRRQNFPLYAGHNNSPTRHVSLLYGIADIFNSVKITFFNIF